MSELLDSIIFVTKYVAIIFAISIALNILYDVGILIVNSEWDQIMKIMQAIYTMISLILQGMINLLPIFLIILIVIIFGPIPLIIIAVARLFGPRIAIFISVIMILVYLYLYIIMS